jgi:Smg protein
MFDILMYLFENLVHNQSEIAVDEDELTDELISAGFHHDEIYKALAWLEKLCELQTADANTYLQFSSKTRSIRIYTFEEQQRLDVDSRGFLLFLEHVNVIDSFTREMVIDRVMELETKEFDVLDLKWVVLMVLFNVPGKELAYEQMEDLIFEAPEGLLH